MANRYKDPNELNNRYIPEDDDDGEDIPEEELTEEEKELMNTISRITPEGWQTIRSWLMDEEDYTLSTEEFHAKTVLAKLNDTPNLPKDMIYPYKLGLVKSLYPDQAFHMVERLKKKPEEGTNIPPEMLDIIYAKAKEYKG